MEVYDEVLVYSAVGRTFLRNVLVEMLTKPRKELGRLRGRSLHVEQAVWVSRAREDSIRKDHISPLRDEDTQDLWSENGQV